MLIDSHCHLNMMKMDTATALSAAAARGVTRFLNISVNLDSVAEVIATAERYPQVYASVGVHPCTVLEKEPSAEDLLALADHPKVIAIGETGLDYYYDKTSPELQQQRFRAHIRAACACAKPLIIHNREARHDTLRLLREEGAERCKGIMHCFVEDWETALEAMALGFYISFSGIVTFKNATVLKQVAKQMPLDQLLIETDSPYLAPVPHRGQPNQPAYVRDVAEYLAELRGDSFETIAEASSQNFNRLFNLAN